MINKLQSKKHTSSKDGQSICYWVSRTEPANNRFLILIHGGASNHSRWSEYVENSRLTSDWNIIVPDMRGNGKSMTRRGVDLQSWCDDLADILHTENALKVVLVGHSLGAHIALNFAARHPHLTRGLVLLDPTLLPVLEGRYLWVRRNRWLLRLLVKVILIFNFVGLRRRKFPIKDLQELDKETRIAIRKANSFEEIAKRYGALGPILETIPIANYIRQALAMVTPLPSYEKIKAPLLVMLSGATTMGNFEKNRQQVEQFEKSELVVINANHWPLTESPRETREAIDSWVSKTWPLTSTD